MLTHIRTARATLPRAERRVADWVVAHPRETMEGSVARVAAAAGSSEPTVIRFCRRLGLSGFRDLKLRLAESLSQPSSYLHADVAATDKPADAAVKVYDRAIRALVESRNHVRTQPLASVVATMAASRQLVFAGLGASAAVARDACQKFFRLGLPCTTATDTPTILQMAAVTGVRSTLVLTSHTGRWPDLVEAARRAGDNGAAVVAVTDPASPLAAAATLVLACHATEDTSIYTPMSSRLAQLVLLDAVQVALALELGDSATTNLRATKAALDLQRRFER